MKHSSSMKSQTRLAPAKSKLKQEPSFQYGTDPQLSRSFRGHEDEINSIDFDPKMRQVASASKDSIVYVWNFKPQQRPFKFIGHKGSVQCVKFSPNGEIIATSGIDRQIRLWSNSVQPTCAVIKSHSGTVRSLNFSKDGAYLLSGSDDKTLKLWRVQDTKFMYSLNDHTNWVRTGVISPEMRLILSGSDDKTVKLWDFNNQKLIQTFSQHKDIISQVLFHPDGTCIFSASNDSKIKVTDLRSNKLIQHYNAHDSAVTSISIHPTGYFLASTGADSKIKIWDLRLGKQLYTLYPNDSTVNTVNFNAAGDYFATAGTQGLAMVWKTNFDADAPGIEQLQPNQWGTNGNNQKNNFDHQWDVFAKTTPNTAFKKTTGSDLELNSFTGKAELNNAQIYDSKQYNGTSTGPQFFKSNSGAGIQAQMNESSIINYHKKSALHHMQQQQQQHLHTDLNASQSSQPQQKYVPITFPPDSVPKIDQDNLMTEALTQAMSQMYSKIDSMVNLVSTLNNRVSHQESLLTQQYSQFPRSYKDENKENQSKSLTSQNYQAMYTTGGGGQEQLKSALHTHSKSSGQQRQSIHFDDQEVENIFQAGALANTATIEASLLNEQDQDEE